MRSYQGVLAHDIAVTGDLPEGRTTANVRYFIADLAASAVVGTIELPDACEPKTSVSLILTVPRPGASLAIGTFKDGVFEPSPVLSVAEATGGLPDGGAAAGPGPVR